MTPSIIYYLDGEKEKVYNTFFNIRYFQKNLDIKNKNHLVELNIAQKLLYHPHQNLVKVLDICLTYPVHIKYELLDVEKELPCWDELEPQLVSAIHNLHEKNCIYIDWKEDNLGYSNRDKCWKMFDFDCSGLCSNDFQKWTIQPPSFFRWNDISSMINDLDNFLEKVNSKISSETKEKLQEIIKMDDFRKYDSLGIFLDYGKIVDLDYKYK